MQCNGPSTQQPLHFWTASLLLDSLSTLATCPGLLARSTLPDSRAWRRAGPLTDLAILASSDAVVVSGVSTFSWSTPTRPARPARPAPLRHVSSSEQCIVLQCMCQVPNSASCFNARAPAAGGCRRPPLLARFCAARPRGSVGSRNAVRASPPGADAAPRRARRWAGYLVQDSGVVFAPRQPINPHGVHGPCDLHANFPHVRCNAYWSPPRPPRRARRRRAGAASPAGARRSEDYYPDDWILLDENPAADVVPEWRAPRPYPAAVSTGGGTGRVRLVREEGRDVSSQYGREGEGGSGTCPGLLWSRSGAPRPPSRRPPPPPRTSRTRRAPHPVLIGHAAPLTPYQVPLLSAWGLRKWRGGSRGVGARGRQVGPARRAVARAEPLQSGGRPHLDVGRRHALFPARTGPRRHGVAPPER
jgi:hypothetical protein